MKVGALRTHALVALASVAVLAHEVALLRVLAIAHWHHAAHLIVAVAFCAFGAAGTAMVVFPRLRDLRVAHVCAGLYAAAIPVSLWAASRVPFNALAVGWQPAQWAWLLLLQGIFLAPLLLGALAVQIPLSLAGRDVGALYATNLVGSGAGALGVLPALSLGPPEEVLRGVALLPAIACVVGAIAWRSRAVVIGVTGAAVALAWPGARMGLTEFKPLRGAMNFPGATVVERWHTPRARIDLVRAEGLRHVAGLSLLSKAALPRQTIVFVDGEDAGALVADGDAAYFGDTLAAAPLSFLPEPRVLVLGGAGNVEEAFLGADRVARVDAAWTGRNPRQFLEETRDRYDLVLLRAHATIAMSEDPLLTIEAFRAALRATSADGAVFVLVPVHTPPREELRVIATARATAPWVGAVRSLDLVGVLMRHRPPTAGEAAALAKLCRTRGFDLLGGGDFVHEGGEDAYAAALLGEPVSSRYRTEPATDDSPYFHRFLRWSRLRDELSEARTMGAAHVDWGTIVVLAAALQVTLLGVLLVALPLLTRRIARSPPGARRFALLHFLAIGVAYALIEMAFLGRLTIQLASPAYATGAVVCAFLVGSGAGALTGARIRVGAVTAAALALAALLLLPRIHTLPGALLLCAAVAVPMGIPFPAGLRRLSDAAPDLVPWALAANGCAAVAATAASPLLASDFGFTAMVAAAAAIYAAVAAWGRTSPASAPSGE